MSDLVESCKEFVRRIVGCLIELGGGEGGGGMEFLMRIARYLIELGGVRSVSGELRCI